MPPMTRRWSTAWSSPAMPRHRATTTPPIRSKGGCRAWAEIKTAIQRRWRCTVSHEGRGCTYADARALPSIVQTDPLALGLKPGWRRHVLGLQGHAGVTRDGLEKRGEILCQVTGRIGLQMGRADMALQCLARGHRDRHSDAKLARRLQAEVEILAQQRRREGRGPVEIDQRVALVAREYRAHDAVIHE